MKRPRKARFFARAQHVSNLGSGMESIDLKSYVYKQTHNQAGQHSTAQRVKGAADAAASGFHERVLSRPYNRNQSAVCSQS